MSFPYFDTPRASENNGLVAVNKMFIFVSGKN
jgi:hypothetical protein